MPPPSRWKPHVTVAAVASRARADGDIEYLLVEEETRDGLVLNNPAGHLDAGESLVEAVRREALEETARPFEPERLVGIYLAPPEAGSAADGVTYLRFAFAGTAGEPELGRTLDEPVVRTHWMTIDEARACHQRHRSALVLQSLEDHAGGRSYPLDVLRPGPGDGE